MKLTRMQARQGNPAITDWCPRCQARMVPLNDGTCPWCTDSRWRRAHGRPKLVTDPLKPGTVSGDVLAYLTKHGEATAFDIARVLPMSYNSVRWGIQSLREKNKIEPVRIVPGGRSHPRVVFAVKNGDGP